jgi:uncharacterized protein
VIRDGAYWAERLQLAPHPEGGLYRQTYRAQLLIENLPPPFTGERAASTAIYFLLSGHDFSALHRLRSDELWHFYAGGRLIVSVISPQGRYSEIHLGSDIEAGETFQAVVPAGCWFASRTANPESFSLAGCTVAPGFDFADFELAHRETLAAEYPQHRELILQLTRPLQHS